MSNPFPIIRPIVGHFDSGFLSSDFKGKSVESVISNIQDIISNLFFNSPKPEVAVNFEKNIISFSFISNAIRISQDHHTADLPLISVEMPCLGLEFSIPNSLEMFNHTMFIVQESFIITDSRADSHEKIHFDEKAERSDCIDTLSTMGIPYDLKQAHVLVVGAGGIGAEVLKILALSKAERIEVVDMDTVDITNLNRQFLFSLSTVGKPKATVSREALLQRWDLPCLSSATSAMFLPAPDIIAHEKNISDPFFSIQFVKSFNVVINGLDNVMARKHVNRLCMLADTPLVESGTKGFNGQVQPIRPHHDECYECFPKSTDQPTFAVCTIHSRPTTITHCIHYAKELYTHLFSSSSPSVSASGNTSSENSDILDEFGLPKELLVANFEIKPEGIYKLWQELFIHSIQSHCRMNKDRPLPCGVRLPTPLSKEVWDSSGSSDSDLFTRTRTETNNFKCFAGLCFKQHKEKLSSCASIKGSTETWKDDELAINFISAVANLRAIIFHIPVVSLEDIRTIVKAIVPAVATVNAVIASCAVEMAGRIARKAGDENDVRDPLLVYIRKISQKRKHKEKSSLSETGKRGLTEQFLLHATNVNRPQPTCSACSSNSTSVQVRLNATKQTMGSFVKHVLQRYFALNFPTVSYGSYTLFELGEYEKWIDEPLSRWLKPKETKEDLVTVEWVVGDLYLDAEWFFCLIHDPTMEEPSQIEVDGKELFASIPSPQEDVKQVALTDSIPSKRSFSSLIGSSQEIMIDSLNDDIDISVRIRKKHIQE